MTEHHTFPLRSNVPDQPIRIGHVWRERSRSFPDLPLKRVIGFDETGRMLLQVVGAPHRPPKKIKPSRLIGQRRTYRLIEDVEIEIMI